MAYFLWPMSGYADTDCCGEVFAIMEVFPHQHKRQTSRFAESGGSLPGWRLACRTLCLREDRNLFEAMPKAKVLSGDVNKPDPVFAGFTGKLCPSLRARYCPT